MPVLGDQTLLRHIKTSYYQQWGGQLGHIVRGDSTSYLNLIFAASLIKYLLKHEVTMIQRNSHIFCWIFKL